MCQTSDLILKEDELKLTPSGRMQFCSASISDYHAPEASQQSVLGLAKVGLLGVSLRHTYSSLLQGLLRLDACECLWTCSLLFCSSLDWEHNSLPFMGQR